MHNSMPIKQIPINCKNRKKNIIPIKKQTKTAKNFYYGKASISSHAWNLERIFFIQYFQHKRVSSQQSFCTKQNFHTYTFEIINIR